MVTRVVADASVAIKWLLPLQPDESDVEQALKLIERQDTRPGRARNNFGS